MKRLIALIVLAICLGAPASFAQVHYPDPALNPNQLTLPLDGVRHRMDGTPIPPGEAYSGITREDWIALNYYRFRGSDHFISAYGGMYPWLTYDQCQFWPGRPECQMATLKFDKQERMMGWAAAIWQKAGFAGDTKVIVYVQPLDANDNPKGGLNEVGLAEKHNNFFNRPLRLRAGRYKVIFRLRDRFYSTLVTLESEYLMRGQNRTLNVSADRFVHDPVVGTIAQSKSDNVAGTAFLKGRN